MAINNGKYKARTVPVNGGYSYEILYSSLEPEIQEKLEDEEMRSTSLVPIVDSSLQIIRIGDYLRNKAEWYRLKIKNSTCNIYGNIVPVVDNLFHKFPFLLNFSINI
jgi:hypothetical protein